MSTRSFPRVTLVALVALVGGLLGACELPGTVLSGWLVEEGSGRPAAGAPVVVYDSSIGTVVAETVADADGRYAFRHTDIPDGTYRVRFAVADWWQDADDWASASDITVDAADPIRIDAAVQASVGRLYGLVIAGGGPFGGGATVEVLSAGTGVLVATTTTIANGTYEFDPLTSGEYRLRFRAPGQATSYHDGSATAGASDVLVVTAGASTPAGVLELQPESLLTGTIVNGAEPIAGVVVVAEMVGSDEPRLLAVTEADGSFAIGGLHAASYQLTLVDPTGTHPAVAVHDGTDPQPLPFVVNPTSALAVGDIDIATGEVVDDPPAGVQVSAGNDYTCAVAADQAITCWGDDTFGQATPPDGSYTAVDAGSYHSCAIATDQTLACWGLDFGFAETTPPPGHYTSTALGQMFGCAISTDQALVCWGRDDFGQSSPPPGAYSQVVAGNLHSCAIASDQTLACWGTNTTGESSPPPGTFTAVSAGDGFSCGVRTDATLTCWGGGLSSGPNGTYTTVSSGRGFSCAIRTYHTMVCWGQTAPAGTFASVSAGYRHACAITTEESIVCWGDNSKGQATVPDGL